jgi:nitrite reductase (NADH) large subunit
VVIGGGLLGLEAAYGLKRAGADVTVLHLVERLMERQLDIEAAAMLAEAIRAKGIHVRLKAATKAFHGTDRVTGVALADGEIIPADLVVLSMGVRPNVELAAQSGIATGRGIQVDDSMESSQPGIFAIGECAEHRGQVYGLVEPAYEQARVLADRLSGGRARYEGSVLSTNLKVSGTGVFSAGDFEGGEGCEIALLQDRAAGTYRKFVYRGEQLVGCILVGDTQGALWYLRLIREGTDVAAFRRDLPFGERFCPSVAA